MDGLKVGTITSLIPIFLLCLVVVLLELSSLLLPIYLPPLLLV